MKLTTFRPWWTLCCLSTTLTLCPVTQAQAASFGRQGPITFEIPGPAFYPGASLTLDSAALQMELSNGYGSTGAPFPNLPPVGFVAFMNQAKVSLEAQDGPASMLTEANVTYGNRVKTTERAQIRLNTDFTLGIAEYARGSGDFGVLGGVGGLTMSTQATLDAGGGTLAWLGLRVNLLTREVLADVQVSPLEGGGNASFTGGVPIFTFSDIVGVKGLSDTSVRKAVLDGDFTGIEAEGWAQQHSSTQAHIDLWGQGELSGLTLTADGRNALFNAFGIRAGSDLARALDSIASTDEGYGSIRYQMKMSIDGPRCGAVGSPYCPQGIWPWVQVVPEPSTYALMGLGLVGLALVRARRQA